MLPKLNASSGEDSGWPVSEKPRSLKTPILALMKIHRSTDIFFFEKNAFFWFFDPTFFIGPTHWLISFAPTNFFFSELLIITRKLILCNPAYIFDFERFNKEAR